MLDPGCLVPRGEGSFPQSHRRTLPLALILDAELDDSTEPITHSANVVHLEVFGGPRLIRHGRPVPVTPSHLSLLVLLAERGESGLTRQLASELLWPPADDGAVRHRFSQLLYSLNRRVGEGISFAITDEMVTVREGTLASDLDEFHRCLARGDLRRAHGLVEGGYALGLDGLCSEPMASWLDGRRIDTRGRLRRAAAGLWSEAERGARWEEAGTAAEVMLDLDPDDEIALQHFIWARAVQGRVAEARAAFRSFVERARVREAGTDWYPGQETLDLVSRARAIGEAHAAGRDDGLESHTPPRLVGRRSELADFARTIRRVAAERLEIVLVSGEGGIGKTRLVDEGVRVLHGVGSQLMRASSSEFEREIQLGPLLEALATPKGRQAFGALDEPWKTVILGLLPGFHDGDGPIPHPPPLQAGSVPRRLFEAIRQILLRLCDQNPVVLVLDDAQWLDETSAAALDYLRRRWDSGNLTIVLVERPESRIPGSAADRLLRFLGGEPPGVEIVRLEALPRSRARDLIEAVSDRPLQAAERDEILSLARDNPFFLVELTRALAGQRPGTDWEGPVPIPIPQSVEQLLRPKIDRLTDEARRILMLMAVFQDPIEPRGVGMILGMEREACLGALEELTDAGILDWERERASMTHTLLRESVYTNLSPARLSWLHGRVAAYLRDSSHDVPASQLALHCHRAGLRSEALGHALTAAEEAEESGGIQEAIQFLLMALEDCADQDLETDILYRLGTLLHQDQDFSRAAEVLRGVIPRVRALNRTNDVLVGRVRLADARNRSAADASGIALTELKRIRDEAAVSGRWEPVARALDVELHIHDRHQDVDGVRRVLRTAWANRGLGEPADRSRFLSSLAIGHYYGLKRLGLASAIQAVDLAATGGLKEELALGLNRLILALMERGQLDAPGWRHLVDEAPARAETVGNRFVKFSIRENLGIWFMDSGHLDRARMEFQEADRLIGGHLRGTMKFMSLFNWAELAFRTFDIETSRSLFQEALTLSPPDLPLYGVQLAKAGVGLASLHLGDLQEARKIASELPPPARTYHFDPSAFVLFRARWKERTDGPRAAAELLRGEREKIRSRYLPTWSYLAMEEVRLLKKYSPAEATTAALEAAEWCESVSMGRRSAELRALVESECA